MSSQLAGIAEAIAALAEVGKVSEAALADAIPAGGEQIRTLAGHLAPRETGKLAEEYIVMDPELQRDGTAVYVKVGTTKEGFYGRFQEKGTRHQRAYPFLVPAVDEGGQDVAETIGSVVGDAIEAV